MLRDTLRRLICTMPSFDTPIDYATPLHAAAARTLITLRLLC